MKKIYFHKSLLVGFLLSSCGIWVFGKLLMENSNTIGNWIPFILALGCTILFLYNSWFHRFNKEIKPISKEDLKVEFDDHQIIFSKGYYYKYSYIKSNKTVKRANISEVNLNTSPPSFVINDNEVLFIPYKFKENLKQFAEQNDLPIIDRFDIWSAINDPFLDTEFDEEEKERNIKALVKNGVPKHEIEHIRKKIKFTMLSTNALVWEWVNLSQFDYLNWTMLTKSKYWWSMEIALRNYKKKEDDIE